MRNYRGKHESGFAISSEVFPCNTFIPESFLQRAI